MNITLEWLFENSGKVLSPDQWCKLLDVAIIDPDGWRGRGADKCITEPIGLSDFVYRLAECTILPVDPAEVAPRYPAGV